MLSPTFYVRNPHIAFAWLWINGVPITIDDATGKPRHLESFSCVFQIEQHGHFEFQLFDPSYDFIEEQIAKSKGQCTFQFGYTNGLKSKVYSGDILSYVPEFLYDGIRIHLSGVLKTLDLGKQQHTRAWPDKLISDIVQEIAVENGMKFEIDKTKKVEFREELDATDLKDVTWQQHGSDWQFMITKLEKQAVRASDDAGGYVLYYDQDKNTLHFHPPKYEEGPVRTFVWRDKMTEVIKFSPKYHGNALAMFAFGGSAEASSVSAENGGQKTHVQSQTKGTGKGFTTDPAAGKTREPEAEELAAQGREVKDFMDQYFAENEAKFWWYRTAWLAAFTGELEIVGDPRVMPFKKYEIQVRKAKGGLHWTSGLYWSRGVTHTISGGKYTTKLDLWRSDAKTGEITDEKLQPGGGGGGGT